MDKRRNPDTKACSDWRAYWKGARAGDAFRSGGTDHPAVCAFWHDYFKLVASNDSYLEILDIASGSGAVLSQAADIIPEQNVGLASIDISFEAVQGVVDRLPVVRGIVADAVALPLTENCIDIGVSQFGIEYAGVEAIAALLQAIKPGGQVALLMHYKAGAIYEECANSLAAIREVQRIGFVEDAIAMFECAFEVLAGGPRGEYERASQKLVPGFRAMEQVMRQHGKRVAGDIVRRLCLDVNDIHTHLPNYDKREVVGWLQRTISELESYAGRMASMCDASIDEVDFHSVVELARSQDFFVEIAEPLKAEDLRLPLAWAMVAKKGGR